MGHKQEMSFKVGRNEQTKNDFNDNIDGIKDENLVFV